MRKSLFFAGLAAAALTLVGCNKEADFAGKTGKPFQVVLNTVDTRTVIDPDNTLKTLWAENDKINVFHAEAGTTDYKHDTPYVDNTAHPYIVSDTENGVFSGTLMGGDLEDGKSYDWYFYYPYNSYLKSPVNTSDARLYIGGRSDQPQNQEGYDSRLHLAGGASTGCFPLYGIVKNVPAATQPIAPMKHIASAIRINVTNGTSEGITIDEIEFTAPEAIVGNFFISFDKEPLTITPYASQAAATASLKVNNPTVLAAGATAAFYMGIKPFTAQAKDVLTIKVKVGDTVFEKSLTLPSAVEFKSGSIKNLNVTYTGGAQIQGSTLEEIAAMATNSDVQTQEVLVVGKYARGIMLGQDGTFLLAFNNSGVTGAVGDIVTVSGKVGEYGGLKQITNPEVTVISSGNEVVLPEPKVLDGAAMDAYESTKIELIQYVGTLKVSGTYYNVEVSGATKKGSIQYPLNTEALTALKDKTVTATGFFIGITGSSTKYVSMMSTSVEEATANVFDVTPQQIDVAATATSTQITVTGNVEWTAEASEGATIDKVSGTGSGVITVSFAANTTPEPKEYTVFVRSTAAGVNDEFEVDITQAAATPSAFDATIVWDSYADWGLEKDDKGNFIAKNPITLTYDDYLVTIDKKNGTSNPFVHGVDNDARAYAKATVTVKNTKGVNMTELVFNLSAQGKKRLAPITADRGTVAAQQEGDETVTWTGEANEVVFTVGDKAVYGSEGETKAGQLCFLSIDVNEGGQGVVKTLVSIAVTGQKTEFAVGDTFTHDTAVVTATYSDNTTKDVTASATFSSPDMTTAGTKTVTVTYAEGSDTKSVTYDIVVSAPSTITVSQACSLADDASASVSDAIVAALCTRGFIATDGTKNIYVYENKQQPSVALGDKVSFSAVKTTFFGLPELKTITNLTVVSSNNEIPRTAVVDITSTLDTYSSSDTDYLTVTGTLEKSGSYYNVRVAGATRYATPMYLYGIDPSALVGQSVVMTGYFNTINSGKGAVQFIATEIKLADSNAKYCTVSPLELNAAATDQSATFTIQANAAWTVTSDNSAFTVSPASGNADATVTVSFSANGTSAARVANLTVSCPDASISKKVVLTQAAQASQEDSYTIVFGNKAKSATLISATTKASTVITSGTDYVTSQPFTVNSGNVYYGDPSQDNIRIGKSGNASQLTIALSDAGKISASSIVVKCMKMQGAKNTNAQLTVNGVGPKSPATNGDPESDLSFSLSSTGNLESIVLEGTAGIFIYSITVNK